MQSQIPFNQRFSLDKKHLAMQEKFATELAYNVVVELSHAYSFSIDGALFYLGMEREGMKLNGGKNVVKEKVVKEKVVKEKAVKEKVVKEKVVKEKPAFQLPYNGTKMEGCCNGLRSNHGLYTQCQVVLKESETYCKTCLGQATKNESGKPDAGTIDDRLSADLYEYVDPSGKKPMRYMSFMKKRGLSESDVRAEALKFGMNVEAAVFAEVEKKKGRPKTTTKITSTETESDDLFASMVANSSESEGYESDAESMDASVQEIVENSQMCAEDKEMKTLMNNESNASKAAVKAAKEQEKATKAAAKLAKEAEKAAKEAEKLAKEEEVKAAKLAKEEEVKAVKLAKEAEKLAKEEEAKAAKLAKEEQVKAAKLAKEQEKAAAKKAKEEEAKAAKLSKKENSKSKNVAKVEVPLPQEEDEEEEDEVIDAKRIKVGGKTYLQCKNTGKIFSDDDEQEHIGMWNQKKNQIDFNENYVESEAEDEEEEERYD